ncbi:MAG: hypothetical protein ACLUIX_00015 [Oscillospiraceae bacterium]
MHRSRASRTCPICAADHGAGHPAKRGASNAFAEALMQQVVAAWRCNADSMVESQLTGILQELQQDLESQGASLSDYLQAAGLTMEDLRDHARENARPPGMSWP